MKDFAEEQGECERGAGSPETMQQLYPVRIPPSVRVLALHIPRSTVCASLPEFATKLVCTSTRITSIWLFISLKRFPEIPDPEDSSEKTHAAITQDLVKCIHLIQTFKRLYGAGCLFFASEGSKDYLISRLRIRDWASARRCCHTKQARKSSEHAQAAGYARFEKIWAR